MYARSSSEHRVASRSNLQLSPIAYRLLLKMCDVRMPVLIAYCLTLIAYR